MWQHPQVVPWDNTGGWNPCWCYTRVWSLAGATPVGVSLASFFFFFYLCLFLQAAAAAAATAQAAAVACTLAAATSGVTPDGVTALQAAPATGDQTARGTPRRWPSRWRHQLRVLVALAAPVAGAVSLAAPIVGAPS